MEIMVPVWPVRAASQVARSDLGALDGVSVAFVDDNLDPEFTQEVELQLSRQHGAVVNRLVKPSHNIASPRSLIDQALQSRVAVLGVAMCGSCTGATVLDAVTLEKKGIHTVTIVWDTFLRAAQSAARVHGLPGITMAVIPSRKGSDGPEDQRDKARAAMPDIARMLLAD